MIHSIFYSWQSDLPESDKKQYIGTCLQDALSKIKKSMDFSIEYVIDRATSKRIGTIDIPQTIFKKINIAKLFIADVSIIVPETETYMIQELHLPIYHTLCLMLEEEFF